MAENLSSLACWIAQGGTYGEYQINQTLLGEDVTKVDCGPIEESCLTMTTGFLLGRSTAGDGAIENITIGSGLDLTAGVLTADNTSAVWGHITGSVTDQTDVVGTHPVGISNIPMVYNGSALLLNFDASVGGSLSGASINLIGFTQINSSNIGARIAYDDSTSDGQHDVVFPSLIGGNETVAYQSWATAQFTKKTPQDAQLTGTPYQMTNALSPVVGGTTSPTITLPAGAANWYISCDVAVSTADFTDITPGYVEVELYDSTNSVVVGTSRKQIVYVDAGMNSGNGLSIAVVMVPFSAAGGEIITIRAADSSFVPGQLKVTSANIVAQPK